MVCKRLPYTLLLYNSIRAINPLGGILWLDYPVFVMHDINDMNNFPKDKRTGTGIISLPCNHSLNHSHHSLN